MAPKLANSNAVTHGVHSYLTTGKLPAGSSNIAVKLNNLKARLLVAVQERHGQLSVQHELLVHSAVRHEACALLIQKWLADAMDKDKLSADQRITHAKAICNASDARDRAVKALDLDSGEDCRTLYTMPTMPDDPPAETNAPTEPPA